MAGVSHRIRFWSRTGSRTPTQHHGQERGTIGSRVLLRNKEQVLQQWVSWLLYLV